MFGGGGRPESAERYVDAALPRLMGAALSLTGNRHDAEDLVQETLAKVIVHWRRVESADSVDAYVRRAMVNTFVSGKRKRSSREVVSHELVTADTSGPAERDSGQALADRDEVWAMLAGSPRTSGPSSCCASTTTCPTPPSLPRSTAPWCRSGSPPTGRWRPLGMRPRRRDRPLWKTRPHAPSQPASP